MPIYMEPKARVMWMSIVVLCKFTYDVYIYFAENFVRCLKFQLLDSIFTFGFKFQPLDSIHIWIQLQLLDSIFTFGFKFQLLDSIHIWIQFQLLDSIFTFGFKFQLFGF